ncbi:MAG: hypothetical protein DWQ01_14835 [Planctomycetota bacterium]|nr:MAG: hypothetical protein DWQ01_14835 [Planctomycetota bacterium]
MKYFLKLARGRSFELAIEEAGEGRYRVDMDGRSFEADFSDVDRLGQYALRLDGKAFAVSIGEMETKELQVNIAGESFSIVAEDERERKAGEFSGGGKARGETITAFMPGIVIGVRVEVGDKVDAGQAVAVLEAMKMQNEVASEQGGVVEEILVEAGQAVQANQPLLRLGPEAEAAE